MLLMISYRDWNAQNLKLTVYIFTIIKNDDKAMAWACYQIKYDYRKIHDGMWSICENIEILHLKYKTNDFVY